MTAIPTITPCCLWIGIHFVKGGINNNICVIENAFKSDICTMPALGSYAARNEFKTLRSTGQPLPYDFHPDAQASQGSGEMGGGGGGILSHFKDGEQKSAMAKWKGQDPGRARHRFLMCVSVSETPIPIRLSLFCTLPYDQECPGVTSDRRELLAASPHQRVLLTRSNWHCSDSDAAATMVVNRDTPLEDLLLRERANETVTKYVGSTDYRVVLDDIREQFPETFNISLVEDLPLEPELYLKSKIAAVEAKRVIPTKSLNP
eukprot:2161035-Pyramimonas_sp.AAC.2